MVKLKLYAKEEVRLALRVQVALRMKYSKNVYTW
jgi:hypothetical protein